MSFSSLVNLGTVGNSITGQTVSISGCTGPSCTNCTSIVTGQSVNSFPKIIIINDLLKTTPNHRHLIKRDGVWSFTEAKMVMVGDVMYDINNNEVDVVSVTSDNNYYRIYEMDVENLDVFYAEGILTHNYKQPTDPIT